MNKQKCPHCGLIDCWHLKCNHTFQCVSIPSEERYCSNCNMGLSQWERFTYRQQIKQKLKGLKGIDKGTWEDIEKLLDDPRF